MRILVIILISSILILTSSCREVPSSGISEFNPLDPFSPEFTIPSVITISVITLELDEVIYRVQWSVESGYFDGSEVEVQYPGSTNFEFIGSVIQSERFLQTEIVVSDPDPIFRVRTFIFQADGSKKYSPWYSQ